ncbi:MAG: IMP dehydrogenase [Candidatus Caenarcaniphilales bacterium]|jgi:IMP dehydrogenase|nr:IMP dehydrogenase [Candidatus Caenarcaniphilales bacterium]
MHFEEGLTFDDVLIIPQYSDIEHRSDVSLATKIFSNYSLELPFVSANMDTVTEYQMAFAMAQHGACGILHRYMSIEEMLTELENYKELFVEHKLDYQSLIVSLGVQDEARLEAAYGAGIRHFCIDVAHGHHALVKKKIQAIRDKYKNEVHIMAGNVASYEGAKALYDWGADCIKVGIGPGSVCTTRIKTGAGYPQLSAIINAAKAKNEIKNKELFLVADGGIKYYGDITKALAAGADAVMMGSIFAGCKETPGIVWRNENEEMTKSFRGMASAAAQSEFGIENINEEGIALTVKYKGSVRHILPRMAKGLRSGLSYSGAKTIRELQEKVRFVKITSASFQESKPHKASR